MGVGGLYIAPKMLEHLRLVNIGALSVKSPQAYAPLDLDVKPNAQRYEEGTPNLNGYVGLNESLKIIEEFGIENAGRSILGVTAHAASQLSARGYIVDSPMDEGMRSGILMFHHPTLPGDQIASALVANKINVVVRSGRVRFAPHLYTNFDDIDRAVAALP
jgi:selenocysteine lyase/cysteine desulfurase